MRVLYISASLAAASAAYAAPWQSDQPQSHQCPPDIVALATGIHLNIVGQVNGEKPGIETLQTIESATPINQTAFLIAKGELISDIQSGIKIREFNQAIAPANNPANPGLAQYASAQMTELSLSESLTGNAAHDKSILATLLSDVTAGTMLNEENLANATAGCNLGFVFPADTI